MTLDEINYIKAIGPIAVVMSSRGGIFHITNGLDLRPGLYNVVQWDDERQLLIMQQTSTNNPAALPTYHIVQYSILDEIEVIAQNPITV